MNNHFACEEAGSDSESYSHSWNFGVACSGWVAGLLDSAKWREFYLQVIESKDECGGIRENVAMRPKCTNHRNVGVPLVETLTVWLWSLLRLALWCLYGDFDVLSRLFFL